MRRRIRKLIESFSAAGCGITTCVRYERNFRIHLTAVFYVLFFALLGRIGFSTFPILFLCFAVVIGAEMFNTAIELACDRQGRNFDAVTKAIKDISAGAVLVCAVCAAAVGVAVFARGAVIANVGISLKAYPLAGVLLIVSAPAAIIFVKGKDI